MITFLTALISLFIIEILYFKIADKYNIIDKPNLRSSHTELTLRGGGIIFPIAIVSGLLIFESSLGYLSLAVFSIALISFLDDILTLNNKLRIGVHFISVVLILFQIYINNNIAGSTPLTLYALLLMLISIIIIIGIINAYNFMDGINGITALYSLITLGYIYYIQEYKDLYLLDRNIFSIVIVSLLVFGFFNLRKKAKTFSGDVGSISMALWLAYLIFQLIITTHDLKWLLLLGVYGLDAVGTICCRIIRKENIFEAHRSHLYQYLANEKKYPHLLVAALYAVIQMILNLVIIHAGLPEILVLFTIIVTAYIIYRLKNEGYQRLFKNYHRSH